MKKPTKKAATGSAIPFGRSLTYRFAFAAFWSAVARAEISLPPPLDDLGVVKGLILRHLRWWTKQTDIFNVDGTLNIGYTYPNMYLSEDYNSPQSVYWCLKSFIVLGLPVDHAFWTINERPHPQVGASNILGITPKLEIVEVVWPPRHILCNAPEHHFLLSSGQATRTKHRNREAKYGKFAYSSAFGFSVALGPLLEQMAPDSTLSISHDGAETWKVRAAPSDVRIEMLDVKSTSDEVIAKVPALASSWKPWNYLNISIETILIPLIEHYPGWHVRLHKLVFPPVVASALHEGMLQVIDAGFAVSWLQANGRRIPRVGAVDVIFGGGGLASGYNNGNKHCLIASEAGVSGTVDLTTELSNAQNLSFADQYKNHDKESVAKGTSERESKGEVLKPEPNTNLTAPRTWIPTIQHQIDMKASSITTIQESGSCEVIWLATGVFAVSGKANIPASQIQKLWESRPVVYFRGNNKIEIQLS